MIGHAANASAVRLAHDPPLMAWRAIVSYDGTTNDDDGLALGRMLADAGAALALAYVRHSREYDPRREEIAEHDARRRLDHGAAGLGQPDVDRHVVVDPSTGAGLTSLAGALGAELVVFGSDYRTPPGRVEPGASAQQMLSGGRVAVGVAPAGLRTQPEGRLERVAAVPTPGDDAAARSAHALAEALGAALVDPDAREIDLIVVGSQASAPEGRIALGGVTRHRLESARSSVIVLPRGRALAL